MKWPQTEEKYEPPNLNLTLYEKQYDLIKYILVLS